MHGSMMAKKSGRLATDMELSALDLAARRSASRASGRRGRPASAPKPTPPRQADTSTRPIADIWERAERIQAVTQEGNAAVRKMRKAVSDAERSDAAKHTNATGGTGQTIIRMSRTPLMQLLFESAQWERGVKGAKKPIDGEKFGSHELEAAQEIEAAVLALSGALMFKPLSMEKIGHSKPPEWNDKLSAKVERYRKWANHWSIMAKLCDPTLEIVIAAVMDQRPFRDIGADLGFHHERIRKATVRGLRDYAARSGWVSPGIVAKWTCAAALTFDRIDSECGRKIPQNLTAGRKTTRNFPT